MNTKQRVLKFLDKQGFYIVLALCLIVISVTAVFSFTGDKGKTGDKASVSFSEEKGEQANYVGENMVLEDATTNTTTTQTTKAKEPTPAKISISRPVTGEIVMEFATDKLVYNSTLKQWTTHEGIDIAAKEGTPVKAALGGTVEAVNEDALMGQTVVITHENGVKTVYANLSKEVAVGQGDKVTKDQEIGKVGKTAISEFDMEAHLHFELTENDKKKNPAEFMSGVKAKKQ